VAESKPLFYLLVLSAFALIFRELLAATLGLAAGRAAPRRWLSFLARRESARPLRRQLRVGLGFVLVLAAAAVYALVLGRAALSHYQLVQAIDNGLAVSDNVMANLLGGHLFRAPAQFGALPGNYLGVHPDYCALLFLPIYRLRPGPETLLWLQVGITACSVIPLFLLATRLVSVRLAVWVCCAFLSLSPLQGALLFTFSWLPASCLFSFTLYYAVISERRWLLPFALFAVLACSEAGPLNVFALGALLAVSSARTRLGLGLCVLSMLVLATNTWLSLRAPAHEMPAFATALRTAITNPVYFVLDLARASKVTAILHLLAPFALVPLAPLAALVLILPGILFFSASAEFWPAAQAVYPLALAWIPGCLLSLLLTLKRLKEDPTRRALYFASIATLTLTFLSHSYNFGVLLHGETFQAAIEQSPTTRLRYANLQTVTQHIAHAASVAATPYMLPYVSSRADLFDARRPFGEPAFILFSSLELEGTARALIQAAFLQHRYALASHVAEFYLFQRGAETPETVSALHNLGLAPAR
jgi:uncharacterized membrane protein